MKMHRAAILLCLTTAACEDAGPAPDVFIALQSHFADFTTWPKTKLGEGALMGHPMGPRYGYLKQPAPAGATRYPVGALIVKTIENGASMQEWDVFAMAKRGGGYNPGGAKDWEFFTLKMNGAGVPIIFSRGTNPVDADVDGGNGNYLDPGMTGVTCNRCHGVVGTEVNDHVLSAALAPGAR